MALPVSWKLVRVYGQYLKNDGTPVSGKIRFTSSQPLEVDGIRVLPTKIEATLDADGSFEVSLPSTNDPDLSATGWGYLVTERFTGGRDPFYIIVDHMIDDINLVTIAPATPTTEVTNTLMHADIGVLVPSLASFTTLQTDQTSADADITANSVAISVNAADIVTLEGRVTAHDQDITDLNATLASKLESSDLYPAINAQTGLTYTPTLADGVIVMSNAAANQVVIPTNANVAYPIGYVLEIWQGDLGQTTVTGAAGVTLLSPASKSTKLIERNSGASLRYVGNNTWRIVGDLEAL